MIKKIKDYFSLKRRMKIEMLETLASICLYLDYDGHFGRNPHAEYMQSHFRQLKSLSQELRERR